MRVDAKGPLGALVSQGIVAGSSLILQLVVLRELGVRGLGTFSLLFGILVMLNSIQTGWIGDSLTVLNRFEPSIRRALLRSQIGAVVVVAAVATPLAFLATGRSTTTAILFGAACIAWIVEETMRRLFIARSEFWKLVAADTMFVIGSFGLLGITEVSSRSISMDTLMLALLSGAVLATLFSVVLLPRSEFDVGAPAIPDMATLSSFAVWRAAQVGLRPAGMAIVRAVVIVVASEEALGELEAARLLLAPVLTAVNGVGVYLLPTYSRQASRGERLKPTVASAITLLATGAFAWGAIALALRAPLSELMSKDPATLSGAALISWTILAAAIGASVVATNAAVAQTRSKSAFVMRLVDTVVGTALAIVITALGFLNAVPLGLACGAVLGSLLLIRQKEFAN